MHDRTAHPCRTLSSSHGRVPFAVTPSGVQQVERGCSAQGFDRGRPILKCTAAMRRPVYSALPKFEEDKNKPTGRPQGVETALGPTCGPLCMWMLAAQVLLPRHVFLPSLCTAAVLLHSLTLCAHRLSC